MHSVSASHNGKVPLCQPIRLQLASQTQVTWAISSESSTAIGAFGFNGRATVVNNRGLCTVVKLTSWVLIHQLLHAKCCKKCQR